MQRFLMALALVVGLIAQSQAQPQPPGANPLPPPAAPTPQQVTKELCDVNRMQGEQTAGAIISAHLTTIQAKDAEIAKLRTELEILRAGAKK